MASSTKPCLRFLLICFVREIKGFWQSYLGIEVDFRDPMNVSLNIVAKNWILEKLRHSFVDERALMSLPLISSYHWKTLVPFWLRKKRTENAFLTLIVNYRKIAQKNKLCYSRQLLIVFLMIYNVISSLVVMIEKLVFFSKHLHGVWASLTYFFLWIDFTKTGGIAKDKKQGDIIKAFAYLRQLFICLGYLLAKNHFLAVTTFTRNFVNVAHCNDI